MWKIITKFMLTCGLNLCDYFNLTELVDTKKRKQNLYLQFKIPTLRDKYVKSTSPKQVFFFFFTANHHSITHI